MIITGMIIRFEKMHFGKMHFFHEFDRIRISFFERIFDCY